MKVSKASELLTSRSKDFIPSQDPDLRDAIKLGIEALREVERLRSYKAFHVVKLLKGETPEQEVESA